MIQDLLRLIKIIKDETGAQLRLDSTDFNHVTISSDCNQLKAFYRDGLLYLDLNKGQINHYHDCPIKFRCTDVCVADKVNPLIYQIKFILSAKKVEFSNNTGEN